MSARLLFGVCISTAVVLPATSRLLPPIYRHRLPIRSYLHPPLMMKGKNQYIAAFENTKMRKSVSDELPIYLYKKPSRISTVLPVQKIFGKHGMVYLSQTKKRDRGFKKVLDEVMTFKKSFRRNGPRDITPKTVFDFEELVF